MAPACFPFSSRSEFQYSVAFLAFSAIKRFSLPRSPDHIPLISYFQSIYYILRTPYLLPTSIEVKRPTSWTTVSLTLPPPPFVFWDTDRGPLGMPWRMTTLRRQLLVDWSLGARDGGKGTQYRHLLRSGDSALLWHSPVQGRYSVCRIGRQLNGITECGVLILGTVLRTDRLLRISLCKRVGGGGCYPTHRRCNPSISHYGL